MALEAPKKESFILRYVQHVAVSFSIVIVMIPLCVFGLYTWADSLGTCVKRPSFTLLSMLEQSVPWFMNPIQNLVCPH